jgi:hypothetical protein
MLCKKGLSQYKLDLTFDVSPCYRVPKIYPVGNAVHRLTVAVLNGIVATRCCSLQSTAFCYILRFLSKFVNVNTTDYVAVCKINAGHSGRAVWDVGLDRLDSGIIGSNPAQGMDVCPRLSVLCCPV